MSSDRVGGEELPFDPDESGEPSVIILTVVDVGMLLVAEEMAGELATSSAGDGQATEPEKRADRLNASDDCC